MTWTPYPDFWKKYLHGFPWIFNLCVSFVTGSYNIEQNFDFELFSRKGLVSDLHNHSVSSLSNVLKVGVTRADGEELTSNCLNHPVA